jgi:hypothetical protein
LREVVRARNQRRHELRTLLQDRKKAVDTLLELKRGSSHSVPSANTECPSSDSEAREQRALRRYLNE